MSKFTTHIFLINNVIIYDQRFSEDSFVSKFTTHIFLINNVIRFRKFRQEDKSDKN